MHGLLYQSPDLVGDRTVGKHVTLLTYLNKFISQLPRDLWTAFAELEKAKMAKNKGYKKGSQKDIIFFIVDLINTC